MLGNVSWDVDWGDLSEEELEQLDDEEIEQLKEEMAEGDGADSDAEADTDE